MKFQKGVFLYEHFDCRIKHSQEGVGDVLVATLTLCCMKLGKGGKKSHQPFWSNLFFSFFFKEMPPLGEVEEINFLWKLVRCMYVADEHETGRIPSEEVEDCVCVGDGRVVLSL